jgi:hypothetical protein
MISRFKQLAKLKGYRKEQKTRLPEVKASQRQYKHKETRQAGHKLRVLKPLIKEVQRNPIREAGSQKGSETKIG